MHSFVYTACTYKFSVDIRHICSITHCCACRIHVALCDDHRVATEQFTSKSPEQIICECVSGLQSASVNYQRKETVSLSLSYHPFYSALLEPQKAAEHTPEVGIR